MKEILIAPPIPTLSFCMCVCLCIFSCVQLFVTPGTVALQAPLSMGFPKQEYWMSCHFLLQWIFLTQGSNLCLMETNTKLKPPLKSGLVQAPLSIRHWHDNPLPWIVSSLVEKIDI